MCILLRMLVVEHFLEIWGWIKMGNRGSLNLLLQESLELRLGQAAPRNPHVPPRAFSTWLIRCILRAELAWCQAWGRSWALCPGCCSSPGRLAVPGTGRAAPRLPHKPGYLGRRTDLLSPSLPQLVTGMLHLGGYGRGKCIFERTSDWNPPLHFVG